VLKNIQASIQKDLPAMVGDDMPGVDGSGVIELPAEF
jgi:hypothetical protein